MFKTLTSTPCKLIKISKHSKNKKVRRGGGYLKTDTNLGLGRGFRVKDLPSRDLLVDLVELGEFVSSNSLPFQHELRVNAFRCGNLQKIDNLNQLKDEQNKINTGMEYTI